MHADVPVWIGVDVSSRHLDFAVGSSGKSTRVPNTDAGVATLLASVRSDQLDGILCESTGHYHLPLRDAAWEAELPLTIINPAWIKEFRKAAGRKAKTDAVDARLLALYGELFAPAPTRISTKAELRLKELVTLRDALIATRGAFTNRRAAITLAASDEVIERTLCHLNHEIECVDTEIAAEITADPVVEDRYRLLQTMPGVGPKNAFTLLAFLPELGGLHRREVASLGGLAPVANDSGEKSGKRFVRWGRPAVKGAMYTAAVTCGKHPALVSRKDRLRAKHKGPRVINTAMGRWMLTILNVMGRDHIPWHELDQAKRIVEVTTNNQGR